MRRRFSTIFGSSKRDKESDRGQPRRSHRTATTTTSSSSSSSSSAAPLPTSPSLDDLAARAKARLGESTSVRLSALSPTLDRGSTAATPDGFSLTTGLPLSRSATMGPSTPSSHRLYAAKRHATLGSGDSVGPATAKPTRAPPAISSNALGTRSASQRRPVPPICPKNGLRSSSLRSSSPRSSPSPPTSAGGRVRSASRSRRRAGSMSALGRTTPPDGGLSSALGRMTPREVVSPRTAGRRRGASRSWDVSSVVTVRRSRRASLSRADTPLGHATTSGGASASDSSALAASPLRTLSRVGEGEQGRGEGEGSTGEVDADVDPADEDAAAFLYHFNTLRRGSL
eukprot:CAMPEP_0170754790 /NCGR_PEP_ID=MMETSP0437-20130122/13183_1 /TAXON_ID=0 /ORGANISM="Sexangularia sp." /LENGTH=341 /DNA_ID=CAMNT_0011093937 /DNA_START=57 /DNA_END=1082 /DNA_ORIENTATION=+